MLSETWKGPGRRGAGLGLRNETERVISYLTSCAWAGDPEMGNVCCLSHSVRYFILFAAGRSALAAPRGHPRTAPQPAQDRV